MTSPWLREPWSGLQLEWRPIGMLATREQIEAQLQRERGLKFWRAQQRRRAAR